MLYCKTSLNLELKKCNMKQKCQKYIRMWDNSVINTTLKNKRLQEQVKFLLFKIFFFVLFNYNKKYW